ncbi:ATP-binding protein [Spirosoma soli]|uniref:histidine kinase n=1 Tax=Spirosoma soli TaxID=1770529 RepID=A0ABW5M6K9_9BACT
MPTLLPSSSLPVAATSILDKLPDGVACYEAIADSSGTIIDFRLTYYNHLFKELVPEHYQLMLGDQMIDGHIEQEDIWQPIIAHYTTVIESGQAVDYLVADPDQSSTVNLRVSSLGNGVIVTAHDVTAQYEQIAAQNQEFTDLLNASLSNTFLYEAMRDADGRIRDFLIKYANKNAQREVMSNFGKETVGNTVLTIYPNSRHSGQFEHCIRVIETGEPIRLELYYPESQLWYDTSITKLGDGCIVAGLNITEHKRSELRMLQQSSHQERMVNELRQSNENLRQFAQVASHDLQEPLRRIQSFSDILQSQFEDNLSDGERDMTRRIQKSAKRMQMLIKDLLMYSQLATQREPLKPVALSNVLEDVLSDLEMAIAEKNATIDVKKLPIILGSASRLHQLFQNLIANALKFQKADRLSIIIIAAQLVSTEELPTDLQSQPTSFWMITVADNGLGFDEKYKDRIFHPFQRLHDPADYSGTGIGLAICQRVAENHGGAIDVTSELGVGSTFKVFLPVYAG